VDLNCTEDVHKHKTFKAEIIKKLDKGENLLILLKSMGVGHATIYNIRKK
jgi:hypothetical protein